MTPTFSPQVLIVGAGPVGLAAAVELGQRGIRCLVVEQNDRTGHAPRAKTTNVRTCEHLRRWGLVDALRRKSPLGVDYPSNIQFATRLTGQPLALVENAFFCRPGRHPLYAEHAQWVPQYKLEETLREHLETLPNVRLRFATRLESFSQGEDGVTATVRSTSGGDIEAIHASYLIAADGAGSQVRQGLGIAMQGKGRLGDNRMLIFRQPGLSEMHKLNPAVMYWLVNPDAPAVMGPLDDGDRWYFNFARAGDDDDAVAMLRRATGLPLQPEVLSIDDWTDYQLIAQRYRERRVFLAGDACHLHPPYGGYGMNLGVGDAVDLGWKIAAVLQGWGGAGLLDSYTLERQPVHQSFIDEAVANFSQRVQHYVASGMEEVGAQGDELRRAIGERILRGKSREFRALGVVLGTRLNGSTLIRYEEEPRTAADPMDFRPDAQPGSRAPHCWLADRTEFGGALFDRLGQGYTLLVTEGDGHDARTMQYAARECGLPLKVLVETGDDIRDLYARRYVLIRPDQHVAWRGDELPANPLDLLDQVRGAFA